jgi:predicted Na+-dependent transporter
MLTVIFLLSAAVLGASVFRRPTTLWQRAIVVLAAILAIAVLVAWGIEYVMQSANAQALSETWRR